MQRQFFILQRVVQRHIRHAAPVGGRGDGQADPAGFQLGHRRLGGQLQVVHRAGPFPDQMHPAAHIGGSHRLPVAEQFPVKPPVDVARPMLIQAGLGAGRDHIGKVPVLEGGQIVDPQPVAQRMDDIVGAGGLELPGEHLQTGGVGGKDSAALGQGAFCLQFFRLVTQIAAQLRLPCQPRRHAAGHVQLLPCAEGGQPQRRQRRRRAYPSGTAAPQAAGKPHGPRREQQSQQHVGVLGAAAHTGPHRIQ